MKFKAWALAAASVFAVASTSASALTFNLINTGGVTPGTEAYRGFVVATKYWSSVLTNNVTINLNVGFRSLGPGGSNILGQTGSASATVSIQGVENRLKSRASASGVDQSVKLHLPNLTGGALNVITPGYVDPDNKIGIDTSQRIFDNDATTNNKVIYGTTANLKALGYGIPSSTIDGSVTFNSDFDFDFNPNNGTDAGKINFEVVAIHEIGHALGFVSGVDDYDYFGGPNGPCFATGTPDCGITGQDYDANNDYWGSVLDLFRYTSNREGLGGTGPQLDWSIRTPGTPTYAGPTDNPYFSIDSGDTRLFDNYESRGQFNGASYQASHWRNVGSNNGAGVPTQPFLGIMNPTGVPYASVTALDLAAFDAIGWDTSIDALANPGYNATTGAIFSSFVPEPTQWALMVGGFGVLGGAARRRKAKVSVTFA